MLISKHADQFTEVPDYRQFLKTAFKVWESMGHPRSYAAFAMKAGISSKSFPRDVLIGQKRLTAQSLPQFVRGMGLTGDLKQLFVLLVSREEKLDLGNIDVELRLEKVRLRLRRKQQPLLPVAQTLQIFNDEHSSRVFAALGTIKNGASLSEIVGRTGLPPEKVILVLLALQNASLIRWAADQGHAWPQAELLNLTEQGGKTAVRNDFICSLEKIKRTAQTGFSSDSELFFQSVFSVSATDMPQLKKELREVLLRFADTAENSAGDRLVRLATGMIFE